MAGGAAIFGANKESCVMASPETIPFFLCYFLPNKEFSGHGKARGAANFGVNKEFSGFGKTQGAAIF